MVDYNIKKIFDWRELKNELIKLRHHFHKNPELGFKEYQTSDTIFEYLNDLGLKIDKEVGGTGLIATLSKNSTSKTLGIRVDMDALPIEEKNRINYKSKNKGIMHACGHDSHITIGLGIAKVLALNKEKLNGNIKFIFQPAEEKLSGAAKMISDGIFENHQIDSIIGFHNWPELPLGEIGLKKGAIMAAVDKFSIQINGKGGHGSEPHKTNDTVILANNFITRIQTLISREINPLDSAVISIGQIRGGNAFNIIPDNINLKGTVRSFDNKVRDKIYNKMKEILKEVTLSSKSSFNLNYQRLIPATINNDDFTDFVYNVLNYYQELPEVKYLENPSMVGEDFSLFLDEIPGTYFFLGASEKNNVKKLHDPYYNVSDEILIPGVKSITQIAFNYLNK